MNNMATRSDNGNVSTNEDISDEYTDADESMSAPTEFLAEFLSAVMLKDYQTALKYCKLILQYEPNNSTAKEFYPLILEKLQLLNNSNNNEEVEDNSSEDEDEVGNSNSESNNESSASKSSEMEEDDDNDDDDDDDDDDVDDDDEESQSDDEDDELKVNQRVEKSSKTSSGGTSGSYSSLEDDEAEIDQLATNFTTRYQLNDNVDFRNGNHIYSKINNETTGSKIIINNSDSESPTEPITAQTIAMLRARVVPAHH